MWIYADWTGRNYKKPSGRQRKLTWYLVATVREDLLQIVLLYTNVFVKVTISRHRPPAETRVVMKI